MVFAGLSFLYIFLPLVLVLYFIVPRFLRNYVLLLASLVFYYIGEQRLVLIMIAVILLNYGLALLVEKFRGQAASKICLSVAIILNLATLGYFKYVDFFIRSFNSLFSASMPLLNIALPIGISFYTFQAMSYTIDVYRGEVCAAKNPCKVATYVVLFPQLIAGPIVRYSEIEKELEQRTCSISDFGYGVRRFCMGLGKKVLISNVLSELVKTATYTDERTVLLSWLSAVAFTLQIYFDFSGYSDMAIGLCRMFGFHIGENFNYPYISRSITEFWRRWHISLGTWFRDYVYIPLGGNRTTKWKWLRNILVVWTLTGLWHGAEWNFVLWGVSFGILLVIEKLLKQILDKLPCGIGVFYTMFFVVLGFVIFSSNDMTEVTENIGALFGITRLPLYGEESLYILRSYFITFIVAIVAATPLPSMVAKKYASSRIMTLAEPVYSAILLVASTAYLVDGSFNPFLYFRF